MLLLCSSSVTADRLLLLLFARFVDRSSWLRLDANAISRSRFWHHHLECAVVECRLGLREINLGGQIDHAKNQLRVSQRMTVFSRRMVFAELGFSTDAQSARLDADLDLLPVESRNSGACGELFSGFREVELHRREVARIPRETNPPGRFRARVRGSRKSQRLAGQSD
jgi:hypothetical protein